jgi:RNA polymerase sigma-70 factor (ECF subfamily)
MWNLKILFQKHAHEIQRFLQKSGHGSDVAEDLTQEVFLRILGAETRQQADNPRAYLHRAARNLAVDRHRREKIVAIDAISEERYLELADEAPGPESIVSDRQQLVILQQKLASLPPQMRRAFELYRLNDLTISEVAQDLGLSVTRTWTLIRQAYMQLKSALEEDHKQ